MQNYTLTYNTENRKLNEGKNYKCLNVYLTINGKDIKDWF